MTCPVCGEDSLAEARFCPHCGAALPPADAESHPGTSTAAARPQVVDKDVHMWGMFCHLAALVALTGVPLAHVLRRWSCG